MNCKVRLLMQNQLKSHITIIGAGNTASYLGGILMKAGHIIDAVWSRNIDHAELLADKFKTFSLSKLDEIPDRSDFILIAVSDDAIADVVSRMPFRNSILLHTAGSVSKEALASCSNDYGVLYPLQTIRKEMSLTEKLPLLVDASHESVLHKIKMLASSITDLVYEANEEERLKLHLAAVFVSNFTNHLYQLTYEWCENSKLPFKLLLPIIREMAGRQSEMPPSNWQTGPASRGDIVTLNKHLDLLKDHPMMQQVYQLLSDDILARKRKNDELRSFNEI